MSRQSGATVREIIDGVPYIFCNEKFREVFDKYSKDNRISKNNLFAILSRYMKNDVTVSRIKNWYYCNVRPAKKEHIEQMAVFLKVDIIELLTPDPDQISDTPPILGDDKKTDSGHINDIFLGTILGITLYILLDSYEIYKHFIQGNYVGLADYLWYGLSTDLDLLAQIISTVLLLVTANLFSAFCFLWQLIKRRLK